MTVRRGEDFSAQFYAYLQDRQLYFACNPATGKAMGYTRRQSAENPEQGIRWVRASGAATLLSFTIYHQAYSPDFPVPYNVALVALQEGPTMVATVLIPDLAQLRIGMKLTAQFENDGRLVFVPS